MKQYITVFILVGCNSSDENVSTSSALLNIVEDRVRLSSLFYKAAQILLCLYID